MAINIQSITDKFSTNPKRIFLLDSVGACLTAIFLVTILARFETAFGMPRTILYSLSSVAGLYAIFSFCCYFFILGNWAPYLRAVTMANMLYCCLTMVLIVYFYQSLTLLGLFYFLLEIMVISSLILIERMVLFMSSDH